MKSIRLQTMSNGAAQILKERNKVIERRGDNRMDQLVTAAANILKLGTNSNPTMIEIAETCPYNWNMSAWAYLERLIMAGQFIAAEYDRIGPTDVTTAD